MRKNRLLKIAITLCLWLALSTIVKAQTNISFGYDLAGNRTSRTLNVGGGKSAEVKATDSLTNQNAQTNESAKIPVNYLDAVGDYQFTIYPNPTHGQLRVQFNTIEGMKTGQITVYNAGGAKINNTPVANATNDIDLQNQPSGIYIMTVQMNGKTISWKIIKN